MFILKNSPFSDSNLALIQGGEEQDNFGSSEMGKSLSNSSRTGVQWMWRKQLAGKDSSCREHCVLPHFSFWTYCDLGEAGELGKCICWLPAKLVVVPATVQKENQALCILKWSRVYLWNKGLYLSERPLGRNTRLISFRDICMLCG